MTEFAPRFLKDYSAPEYQIDTVNLEVALNDNATLVTNTMSIQRVVASNVPLVLDGEHMVLKSVAIDGSELSADAYQVTDNSLTIVPNAERFDLTIITELNPSANTALEGLYKSGEAYCTQCEAEGFRRISYFLDRPDVMAVYTTKVIADKTQYPYLLANGNKIDAGELDDDKHFVTWHDPFPKPCYLFALVAGNFDLLTSNYTTRSGRQVALELFVDKGNLSRAEHAMTSLIKSMQWDEQVFDLEYDLDIYMIVAVDFFNMGAMENKGLNVFNSKYVLADDLSATDEDFFNIEAVIAHEYFHNWTGNRVTCRDWFQLSLKEGLTVFRDQQFSGDMHSAAVTRIKNVRTLRSLQFAEDAGPMAHPIRPEKVVEMNNFYTMTVYEKGAEVIRMMHTILGKEGFKAGMDLYFERHDGQAVTCDDFVAAMSDASNVDLSTFKNWYRQSGTPSLIVTDSFEQSNNQYQITIKQIHPQTHDKQHKQSLHIPINIELLTANSNNIEGSVQTSVLSELLHLKETEQTWTFSNIDEQPIPVLLGNFSAPVKLEFDYTDEQLLAIMVNASDAFNRWDAGQKLFARYIELLVNDEAAVIPQQVYDAIADILNSTADEALKAEQLTLPSFDEMADSLEQVNAEKLANALSKLKIDIAEQLKGVMLATYRQCNSTEFAKDGKAIGKRALKNVCLNYLASAKESDALILEQFNKSNNMTDQLAAIKVAALNDLPCFEQVMTRFEQQWQDDSLVMDKWFSVNALHNHPDVINRVTNLLSHPKFSLDNPNRARSLIGAFAFSNCKYFHQHDGQGYQFLADQIAKLNTINPQVASRILTPLIQYKSFAKEHQQQMLTQLKRLNSTPNLCRDLQEKLTATLN